MRHLPIYAGFLGMLLAACGGPGAAIRSALTQQVTQPQATQLDLRPLGDATWTRVCFFGPYSGNREAAQALGFAWDLAGKTAIAQADHINVLVFATADRVVAYLEFPRATADFGFAATTPQNCIPRDAAILTKEPTANRWLVPLVPSP